MVSLLLEAPIVVILESFQAVVKLLLVLDMTTAWLWATGADDDRENGSIRKIIPSIKDPAIQLQSQSQSCISPLCESIAL